ncbi:MAG TPA: histidinol-phosphate transaminase [Beutenbergiaceae bacterium]|nr:histidinol-phosphate transaminase [Beutenbergiaceae bacterium]
MTSLPIRTDLAGFEPYGAPQLDVPHPLNVNENPYSPPPRVAEAITEAVAAAIPTFNRYPDRDFPGLRADLAAFLEKESHVSGLAAENLWAANGSNEVMLHLFQAFGGPGRKALGFAPTYSMYPEYARDTFTEWVVGEREADYTLDPVKVAAELQRVRPALVLLASPNNPTGTALPLNVIDAIATDARSSGPEGKSSIVVVDEAYAEFRREGTPSALELLEKHPHLAVSRTMSKAFAFAGVRLGYLAGSTAIIDVLRIVRLPYHLSAVTQAVARAALAHSDDLLAQVDSLRKDRDDLSAWLNGEGYSVVASDANFILFGEFDDRHAIWQGLLDRGVLIRETGPSRYLRVSVGTPEQNDAFRRALLEVTGR